MAALKQPYRSPREPEPEILFSAPVARRLGFLRILFGADRAAEIRLERVGALHRLVVVGTDLTLSAPFTVDGASRIEDSFGRRLTMSLRVRDARGETLAIAAFAREDEPAPTRDDWFDGALLDIGEDVGELVVAKPMVLVELRGALAKAPTAN